MNLSGKEPRVKDFADIQGVEVLLNDSGAELGKGRNPLRGCFVLWIEAALLVYIALLAVS